MKVQADEVSDPNYIYALVNDKDHGIVVASLSQAPGFISSMPMPVPVVFRSKKSVEYIAKEISDELRTEYSDRNFYIQKFKLVESEEI